MKKLELDTLTPEQKRVKIAEACGWTVIEGVEPRDCGYRLGHPIHGWEERESLPDYLRDLNAMHAAEHYLTKGQADAYGALLERPREDVDKGGYGWHATAEQRVDAFLLTVG